jgi:hypothetical protein
LLTATAAAHAHAATGSSIAWQPKSLRTAYAPGRQFYCYAPSVLIDDRGVEHLFACRNLSPRIIRDHVFHFERSANGVVGEPQLSLAPNTVRGAWDSLHICDPSVIAGAFRLHGETFRYAMFYLGNDVDACRRNQVGVAFAHELSGPWTRLDRPLIAYPTQTDWGAGQPSAVTLDRAGKVLLFYTTSGNPAAWMCALDLSDADHIPAARPVAVPTTGLTDINGRPDGPNNFDVAFDASRNRFWMVREAHPYPKSEPSFISAHLQIASIDAAALRSGSGVWRVEGSIGPDLTHFARNHNPALARDAFGALPDPREIRVVFSSSQAEPELHGLFAPWTYALQEIRGDIPAPK